jgi:signal peptidase I
MAPSLVPGERILYSQLLLEAQSRFSSWGNFGIGRGDLLVISPPYYRDEQPILDFVNPFVRFFTLQKLQFSSYSRPLWEKNLLIKRVIALPGDTVKIINHRAYVKTPDSDVFVPEDSFRADYTLNKLDLPSLWMPGDPMDGRYEELTLGEDEYFVLGDSRGQGSDSYLWGALKRNHILGKVFFRYWPFTTFSFL